MSTVANAMAAMGYVPAKQRASCGNCLYGQEQTDGLAPRWWCAEGAFRVSAMAVCTRHEPRGYVDGPLVEQPA